MDYKLDLDNLRPSDTVLDRNRRKPGIEGGDECFICDSPVKPGTEFMVVCVDGGRTMVPDERFTDRHDPGFMGAYPVGPTCARKVRKLFKETFNETLKAVQGRGP